MGHPLATKHKRKPRSVIRPPDSFATPPILRGRHCNRVGARILAPRTASHPRSHLPLPIVAPTPSSPRRHRTPHGSQRGGHDTAAPVRPWHGGRPRSGMPGCRQRLGGSTVWPSLGAAVRGSRRHRNQLRRDSVAGTRQRRRRRSCWCKLQRSFKGESPYPRINNLKSLSNILLHVLLLDLNSLASL